MVTSNIGRVILDVAAINYKSRRIGPAPIAIHFPRLVAGRVDHCRIDIGRENLNGPRPANFGVLVQVRALQKLRAPSVLKAATCRAVEPPWHQMLPSLGIQVVDYAR